MSNEREHLLEHEYDGIREYDNPLPRWWSWIFYATILFSAVYLWNPGRVFAGPGRITEYRQQLADAEQRWPKQAGGADLAALAALRNDPDALALGRTTFATYCAPCHRPDGGGLIGPNLTDEFWIHGGGTENIHATVSNGVLEKGMPAWSKTLKPEQVNAVVVYVESLQGSQPPNPKAAQGSKAGG